MNFQFEVNNETQMSLQNFLKAKDFSRRLLTRIKHDIRVNGEVRFLKEPIETGDVINVYVPGEEKHPHIIPSIQPLNILYEDEHLIAINKSSALLSTVSWDDPDTSAANRLLNYYLQEDTENKRIHLVSRLDRNTSGVLLVAKHQLAHSKMDKLLQAGEVYKEYFAIAPSSENVLADHGRIDAPIGRSEHSIIERKVREDGKSSLTEYWRLAKYPEGDVFRIKLHTGRTHQIRVHFAHMNLPLLGDDLYGGVDSGPIKRQALHCRLVSFIHPLTHQELQIEAPLADDLNEWINQQ